jgi:hypothetical protein
MLRLIYEYLMVTFGFYAGKLTFRLEYADGTKRLRTVHYRRSIDIGAAANKLYSEDTYHEAIDDIAIAYTHGSKLTS